MQQDPAVLEYIQAWVDHFLAVSLRESDAALGRMEIAYKQIEAKFGAEQAKEIDKYVNYKAHEIASKKLTTE